MESVIIGIRKLLEWVEKEGAKNFITLEELSKQEGVDENTVYMRFLRSSKWARKIGYQRLTVRCGRNGLVIFRKKVGKG